MITFRNSRPGHWVEFKHVVFSMWHDHVSRAVAVIQPVRHSKFSKLTCYRNKKAIKFVRQCACVFGVLRTPSRLTWERATYCFPRGATVVFVNHHFFIVVFAFCLPYRFTFYIISCRRLMNACQSSWDPPFRALLWSRFLVFISFFISEVMDGFC